MRVLMLSFQCNWCEKRATPVQIEDLDDDVDAPKDWTTDRYDDHRCPECKAAEETAIEAAKTARVAAEKAKQS